MFQKEGHGRITSGTPDPIAELPEASCGRFENLKKKERKNTRPS